MSRRKLVRAGLVALVAIALTTASAIGSTGLGRAKKGTGFSLSGHVTNLLPGQRKHLVIVVRNRGSRALLVRVVTTQVRDASRACKARNLRVAAFHGALRVAGHRSPKIAVRVSMRADTPCACQGAVFRLAFHGRATPG